MDKIREDAKVRSARVTDRLPFEEINVKRATVAESRLYPSLPSHKSPPPERFLFSKNKVMESSVVESLIPLT